MKKNVIIITTITCYYDYMINILQTISNGTWASLLSSYTQTYFLRVPCQQAAPILQLQKFVFPFSIFIESLFSSRHRSEACCLFSVNVSIYRPFHFAFKEISADVYIRIHMYIHMYVYILWKYKIRNVKWNILYMNVLPTLCRAPYLLFLARNSQFSLDFNRRGLWNTIEAWWWKT